MDENWVSHFLSHPDMEPNRTGHAKLPAGPPAWGGRDAPDAVRAAHRDSLGLGWLYYGLTRALEPRVVLSIGSGRGFVPILLAKAQRDRDAPAITFVDPSFDDDFWTDAEQVRTWFKSFGVEEHIVHHLMTTEQFAATEACAQLPPIDLLFIDGGHFYEAVETDFRLMSPRLAPGGTIIFHDTVSRSANPKWSGPRRLLLEIEERHPQWQLLDLPFGAGVTIMRERAPESLPAYFQGLHEQWPDLDSTAF
ncbi:class I SAM-dependent methyltransferase [Streptantibioticus parmotrematis]|uniref:class I SAM-dependent methyltransferase n=1 Tax=Streptantibioticus parmotrematis TaxID=2873249 RepID=UPI0033F72BD6